MNINYSKLSKAQAELDNYIAMEKCIDMKEHKLDRIEALSVEFHELLNELRFFKYWSVKPMNRERALEEYVDCIHFLLPIGNDLGVEDYVYTAPKVHDMRRLRFGIMNMISRLGNVTDLSKEEQWLEHKILFDHFLLLGEKLGFTENEILTSYELKHAENYNRQANGY